MAQQEYKLSYTAQSINERLGRVDTHKHSWDDLQNKPTIPSIEGLATKEYVDSKIVVDNKEYLETSGGDINGYLNVKNTLTAESLLIVGNGIDVYEGDIHLTSQGDNQEVKVSGRDYTSHLTDQEVSFADNDNPGSLIARYTATEVLLIDDDIITEIKPGQIILTTGATSDEIVNIYGVGDSLYINNEKVFTENELTSKFNLKQDKLTGTESQFVGFDANGNAVARDSNSVKIIVREW